MKKIFSLLLTVFLISHSFSQEITLLKNGRKFEKDGVEYKMSKYREKFKNPIAVKTIKSGRTMSAMANILGFGGGVLIGAGLPNALSETTYKGTMDYSTLTYTKTKVKKPGWTLITVGGLLVAGAIPLAIVGKNKVKKGVEIENQYSPKTNTTYHFDLQENGLAFSIKF